MIKIQNSGKNEGFFPVILWFDLDISHMFCYRTAVKYSSITIYYNTSSANLATSYLVFGQTKISEGAFELFYKGSGKNLKF